MNVVRSFVSYRSVDISYGLPSFSCETILRTTALEGPQLEQLKR
jgi:hypothetical protein